MAKYLTINIKTPLLQWQAKHDKYMSRVQLAERVGIAIPTVYRWLAGDVTNIPLTTLAAFCEALDCDIDDILVWQNGDGE